MYTLIIVYYLAQAYATADIESVPGFHTLEACETAAGAVRSAPVPSTKEGVATSAAAYSTTVCVSLREPRLEKKETRPLTPAAGRGTI